MGTEGRFENLRRGSAAGLLAALLMVTAALPLQAHEGIEQRQVVVSLAPDRIDMLVAWELPAGAMAAQLRSAMDLDGDGLVQGDHEILTRAQLLIPRLVVGIELRVGEEAVSLDMIDVELRDGSGSGPRQGFEAMALYHTDRPLAQDAAAAVVVGVADAVAPVRAEVQWAEGLVLEDSSLPPATDAPAIGPAEVLPGLPVTVRVRRAEPD